ncbi:hypothetical protein PRUPE_1G533300 [Prunus persica]|uniref:DRBM domain-containing protein n=2 Tax=Prunus persica TaxID=3760 RepID=A0A251RJL5_PRUPE|nr:uncharacterized protein LOC18788972 [Prunus persica]ONI35395.1 hypothetical protein PRUPE_1G533300 [Prunus persica]ONI35396.1 hypothetical protein PRUPE_1G533300 [Prunus persica]
MATNEGFQGVSNCYVFKSQLQEYAQKVEIPTPVYETIKEGPSHEPSFKSTVIVNNVRYDSLLGFSNRKLAEQSAAEVALVELAKSGDINQSISQPIHETGLCKNLLQEYAQKMNYAIPLYQCQKEETPGRVPLFSCTVEIGGIRYVGAAAKTKKEAEIKVARTALLAIRSSKSESSMEPVGNTQLTVLPSKKRRAESNTKSEETANVPKPKKGRFKKRNFKKKLSGDMVGQTQVRNVGDMEVNVGGSEISGGGANPSVKPMDAEVTPNTHDSMSHVIPSENQTSALEPGSVPQVNTFSAKKGESTASFFNHGDYGTLDEGAFPISYGNITPLAKEVNMVSGAAEVVSLANNSNLQLFNHGDDNGTLDVEAYPISCGNLTSVAEEENMVSGAGESISLANNSNLQLFNHGEDNGTLDVDPISCGNITSVAEEANMVSKVGEAVSLANNSSLQLFNHSDDNGTHDVGAYPISCGNITSVAEEANMVSGAGEVVSVADNSNLQLFNHNDNRTLDVGANPISCGNVTSVAEEANMVTKAGEAVSLANNSDIHYLEASSVMAGLNQSGNESKQV